MTEAERRHLELTVPASVDSRAASVLHGELSAYLDVGQPRYFLTKSLDADGVIQLIGSAPVWMALGAAATAFLVTFGSTTGKRLADDVYDLAKAALKRKELAPVANVSEAFAKALKQAGPRTSLVVGINVPDAHWGTALVIKETEAEKIAIELSRFAVNVTEVSRVMNAQLEAGHKPLGRAFITFEDDEVVVRWTSQDNFEKHEIRMPDLSKKLGPEQPKGNV